MKNLSEDLIDILWESLKKNPARQGKWGAILQKPYNLPYTSLRGKRLFFSEYEIKRLIREDGTLPLPRLAILSPLAQDWLTLRGIRIVLKD